MPFHIDVLDALHPARIVSGGDAWKKSSWKTFA
jgi:hypothetical protein